MNKWPELGSYPDALSVCFWVLFAILYDLSRLTFSK
jgi:hypothetical protein